MRSLLSGCAVTLSPTWLCVSACSLPRRVGVYVDISTGGGAGALPGWRWQRSPWQKTPAWPILLPRRRMKTNVRRAVDGALCAAGRGPRRFGRLGTGAGGLCRGLYGTTTQQKNQFGGTTGDLAGWFLQRCGVSGCWRRWPPANVYRWGCCKCCLLPDPFPAVNARFPKSSAERQEFLCDVQNLAARRQATLEKLAERTGRL